MNNLTRIIGGVIAAGALAAGASAFTASGVATDTGLATGIVGGGSVSIQVNELGKVMSASLIQDAADPSKFTGVIADVKGTDGVAALPVGSTVKAKLTGTGGDAVSGWLDCVEATGKYSCAITDGTYFATVSDVDIAVFGPTA